MTRRTKPLEAWVTFSDSGAFDAYNTRVAAEDAIQWIPSERNPRVVRVVEHSPSAQRVVTAAMDLLKRETEHRNGYPVEQWGPAIRAKTKVLKAATAHLKAERRKR